MRTRRRSATVSGWSVKGEAGVHIYRDGVWEHHATGSTFSLDLARDGG